MNHDHALETTLRRLALAPVLLILLATGCTYQSNSFGDIRCENEGETRGNDVCTNGFWVTQTTPPIDDMDMVTPVDMDMSDPPDDGPCVPESNQALCVAAGAECGMLPSTLDSCGTRRTPMCGDCPGDGNACVDNKCSCEAESDEAV